MANKMEVKSVAGKGRFNTSQSPIHDESAKNSDEEKLLKEKLLDEKMRLIRQKNEERLKRQKEIEDDIKNASSHSCQIAEEKPALSEHKMAGVRKDIKSLPPKMRGRARGRILAKMAKEELLADKFENKRKQNDEVSEKKLQDGKSTDSPPKGGSSSFLSDDRRVDMSNMASRSSHSWGGSQFEDVVERVNKEHSRPRRENQNIELAMTGRERKEYMDWKEERNRIDRERKLRQKSGHSWQREWDKCKVQQEANSTQDRHEQQNRRRSGQRFGERTRRKPDWDLHDDRFAETEDNSQHTSNKKGDELEERNDQEQSIVCKDKSEDWDKSSSTSHEIKAESSSALTANMEDTATKITKDNSYTSNTEETNVTVNDATTNPENINEYNNNTDKADSQNLEEISQKTVQPRIEETLSQISDIKNLTVIIDSEGKRSITDEPPNENESPDKTRGSVNEKNMHDQETINCKQQDEVIEQPKPQRVHKKHRKRENKETKSRNLQEKEDFTKSSLENQTDTDKDGQIKSESTNEMSTLHHETSKKDSEKLEIEETDGKKETVPEKSKDNLPKLELKKTDENIEADFPEFLKTPQKKNWADCEFDEELELPPLEWDSLTKK